MRDTTKRTTRAIKPYVCRVVMYDTEDQRIIESVNAYKSHEKAQELCDRMNTPEYTGTDYTGYNGEVAYKVVDTL